MKTLERVNISISRKYLPRIKSEADQLSRETGTKVSLQEAADRIFAEHFTAIDNAAGSVNGPNPNDYITLWATTPELGCTSLGPFWYKETGTVPQTQLGYGCEELVHPDDRWEATETYRTALKLERPFFCEYRLECANGEYKRMRSHGTPVYRGNKLWGFVGSAMEIQGAKPAIRSGTLLTIGVPRIPAA